MATFVMRTTHPDGRTNKYYRISAAGGYCKPPVIEGNRSASNRACNCANCKGRASNGGNLTHNHIAGSVLQNCKGYATGRFMESQGVHTNKIPSGEGKGLGFVYDKIKNKHIYEVGQTPRQGALVIWANSGDGHIAFVEKVYSNTDVLLSESHWSSGINNSDKSSTNRYGYFGIWRGNPKTRFQSWIFKGYVYAPVTWDAGGEEPQTSPSGTTSPPWDRSNADWVSKNAYLGNADMRNNALLTYSYLIPRGWSHNAVCALLGNMQKESTINPGVWEGLKKNVRGGYGLVQWTPSTKYTNWAAQHGYDIKDGDPQLEWIDTMTVPAGQWVQRDGFNISFNDWKTDTTHDIEYMTRAFERDFENSNDNEAQKAQRVTWANAWSNWLRTQIIKIPNGVIGDPNYDMSDDDYPDLGNVSNPVIESNPGNYHKPNNKHMLIARRPFVY